MMKSFRWIASVLRRIASRRTHRPPVAPVTLYDWLVEVRRTAQDELGLPCVEFEHSIGSEAQRFLLAWRGGNLQLLISNSRCRFRFASTDTSTQRWFDVAPPAPSDTTDRVDDRFWQLETEDPSWIPVYKPEQHAQGLMLAKLFFACWEKYAGRQPADRRKTF